MKKLLLTAAALSILSTPALADSTDSTDVVINASVAEECSIDAIPAIEIGDITINEDPGADALQIVGDTQADVAGIWVSCNYNNRMTLSTPTPLTSASSAGLTPSTGSASFTNQIHYHLRANNYGTSPEANSLDTQTSARSTAPIHKQIRFRAIVKAADNTGQRPYAADDYTATATVSMSTV